MEFRFKRWVNISRTDIQFTFKDLRSAYVAVLKLFLSDGMIRYEVHSIRTFLLLEFT